MSSRVLVIDDEEPIRAMLKSVLELEGYSVNLASSGSAGVKTLQNEAHPDVILLDMMMPGSNGWDFLDVIRLNAKTSKIPVIVISAYPHIAKSVNPQAFVPKPIQLKFLLSALEQVVA